jgi:endonuclease-8
MAPLAGQRVAALGPGYQSPYGLAEALDGQELEAVEARGKHLLVTFGNGRILHSHLRMTGAWHVYPEGQAWARSPRGAWLTLSANDLVAVQFGGPVLELLDRARVALHPALRSLGPDLLDEDPRIDVAVQRARTRVPGARPIGEVLLDQTVAAGIGNVVRCEALHALRVDPWAPLAGFSDSTVAALLEQSRRVLQAGVRSGGALPRTIYGRRICPRCGGVVQRRGQGDQARTLHWCPACQLLQND